MSTSKNKRDRGVIPAPAAARPLTSAQETFRNLLAKVESLREAIDDKEADLDATLSFYAAEIVPRLARQTALQKDLLRALAPYLNRTFFPHKQERFEFREFVQELLDEIMKMEKGLTDLDLREIYKEVHGVGYLERERKTLTSVKEALSKLYAEAGMEADFSELESATSEAEFMAKAEELTARVRKMKEAEVEAARCNEHGHHLTDDDELRAAEEARKRSIATIYKQLARVLHPDLERDRERQKEKVELMQELTVAFRQNDLHTLLRLEMQWIENEGGNIERLTEEKLGVYIEVLDGQVEGLERRLRDLIFHPRYRPVVVFSNGRTLPINGPNRARDAEYNIASLERSIELIRTARTPQDVRAAIGPIRSGMHPEG